MPDPALVADESRAWTETLELISSALSRLKDAEQRILDLELDLHNSRERYGAEVKVLEPFRKELESRESLVIPWTAPDSEVPHVEAGTSSGGGSARPALRE